jgi:hypothetical protein
MVFDDPFRIFKLNSGLPRKLLISAAFVNYWTNFEELISVEGMYP